MKQTVAFQSFAVIIIWVADWTFALESLGASRKRGFMIIFSHQDALLWDFISS
jgi:hypothetical protein